MTKKRIMAAALLLAVMTAAAGCGGKGGEKTENAWESIPSAQESTEPAAAGETAADAGENAGGSAAAKDGSAAAETADAGTEGQTEDPVGALYTGTWVDEIAGRAYMVISPASDGTYDVEINWSSSAAETSAWRINAAIDRSNGNLVYEDGTYQALMFNEDGEAEVVEEKKVNGFFIYAEGGVHWTDSVEHADAPEDSTTFVREEDFGKQRRGG